MSQCARVALWVPTEDPPDPAGDGVLTSDLPDTLGVIPTRFAAGGGGGGGGGIPEAPVNGKPYARKDGAWLDISVLDAGQF